MALSMGLVQVAAAREMRVTTSGDLQAALSLARPGDVVRVAPGTYRGPFAIPVPGVTVQGEGLPTLDGDGKGTVVMIPVSGVTLRGFHVTRSGQSRDGDDSGIKLINATGCQITGNVLDHVYHGIYLQKSPSNEVRDNRLAGEAPAGGFPEWGDGIHVWNAPRNTIVGNRLTGFRDGLYFEFAAGTRLEHNDSAQNQRYGLHFMFMDDSSYRYNRFRRNKVGSVLMYSRRITVVGNEFGENLGAVGDGVMFKENVDSVLVGNRIVNNTVGLFMDGANRNRLEGNVIAGNGWGLLLFASSVANVFKGNVFAANGYEVAVDMPTSRNTLDGNYWSGYQGYDLDGDGRGDVPYSPVTLFSFLAMQYPDLYAFVGSPAVRALSFAQRVLPALSPSTLQDPHPLMTPRLSHGPG